MNKKMNISNLKPIAKGILESKLELIFALIFSALLLGGYILSTNDQIDIRGLFISASGANLGIFGKLAYLFAFIILAVFSFAILKCISKACERRNPMNSCVPDLAAEQRSLSLSLFTLRA